MKPCPSLLPQALASRKDGMTLVEVMVALSVALVLMAGVSAIARTAAILTAKSLSLNMTGNAARYALDRVESLVEVSNNTPQLINDLGGVLSATSAAAGVVFDRYIGGPYLINIPSPGGLAATGTSLTLTRATNAQVVPPDPQANDDLLINMTASMSGTVNQVRTHLTTPITVSPPSGNLQAITVALSGSLGVAILADGSVVSATLVRRTALVVKAVGSGRELRLCNSYQAPADLDTPSKYVVLTDRVAMQLASDATPFTLSSTGTRVFVGIALRVRSREYGKYLASKQGDRSSTSEEQFATFMALDSVIPLKSNPSN